MTKRMMIMLAAVALVLGLVFGYKTFVGIMTKKFMAGMAHPTETVTAIKAGFEDWQPRLQSVGSLRAINGADLSSEVSGIVKEIHFESGQDVEAGTVLLSLVADEDIAHLQSLQASAKLAAITVERDLKQIKSQAISQATLDSDEATLASAKASVNEQQAAIDKKIIKAPFSGHLGIRQVDIGQYLTAGTAIVTLQQLDPLYVDFYLPEQKAPTLALGQKVVLTVDAFDGATFDGDISAINPKVEEATRNVQVRATFKNPEHKLMPGMFGRVNIDVGQPQHYITLPQTAVTFNPYGNTIYKIENKTGEDGQAHDTAQQSVVITGETRGDQVAVLSGVKEGETIITSGQVKLRNGTYVVVDNSVTPTNDPAPTPHDR